MGLKIMKIFFRFLVKLNWSKQQKTNLNMSLSLDLGLKTESHSCETASKGSTKSVQIDDPKEILKLMSAIFHYF